MKVKTIQCLIVDDEAIAREILENHLSRIESLKVIGSCKNAVEAFNILSTERVDLMFLDINMPEISGLALAKTISREIKIIFTTAYREFAVEGFDLQAVDYLLKPISFERLIQSVNKYLNENSPVQVKAASDHIPERNDYLFVRSDRKMVRVNFSEILYIESLADYVKIYLPGKSVVTRDTITSIEAKLPQKDFIRTHRSFIVAKASVESFTSEFVEIGQKQIPISRNNKNEVLEKLER